MKRKMMMIPVALIVADFMLTRHLLIRYRPVRVFFSQLFFFWAEVSAKAFASRERAGDHLWNDFLPLNSLPSFRAEKSQFPFSPSQPFQCLFRKWTKVKLLLACMRSQTELVPYWNRSSIFFCIHRFFENSNWFGFRSSESVGKKCGKRAKKLEAWYFSALGRNKSNNDWSESKKNRLYMLTNAHGLCFWDPIGF